MKSSYLELFDKVRSFLAEKGIECSIVAGEPATEAAIVKAEKKMKIRLPAQFREFHSTVADFYSLMWETQGVDKATTRGCLQVDDLSDLKDLYQSNRAISLYTPEQAEKYGFPYTDDPALAKRTAARMWEWLPFHDEGNGDHFCLDLSVPSAPVIFDKHDWLDGGTGDNGHIMAPDFMTFLQDWASVCFQSPKSCWWPSVLLPGGGINWDSDEFDQRFRIKSKL